MTIHRNHLFRPVLAVLISVLALTACDGGKEGSAPAGVAALPVVTVMTVRPGPVTRTTELPGRTVPYLIAEIRPQVTGIIKSRKFIEGSEVEAGQLLYQIDPSGYQAAYDGARASLSRAEAQLQSARLKAERQAELVKINAVSKEAHDDAQAALKQALADVASARAVLDKARIDLDYTRLTAPISGRIGRSMVTPGALVTANQAEALATVQQLDPIYVDLAQSSADLLRLKREFEAGRLLRGRESSVPVRLVLEDGSEYGPEGRLAFSEVTVDQGTGSVTLRAVFPNPKGDLLPGMYVRARLDQGVDEQAILVPHAAVMRDPKGNAQVLVVNAEDKVELRVIRTAESMGNRWRVTDGLAAGERVIVEGLQKVRPGATVKAEEAKAAVEPVAQAQ
ncbi:efflux RND transporter periplasmic adaptor subunit [Thiofaba sp. EF100]|uniref:efflux RND transporter periplasmic adaptor subunit n=1 Tax=Thiofaba sp. EF100 TaxID=3121274 RepID=UPI00322210F7